MPGPGPAGRPLGAAAKALLAGGLLREAFGGPGRSDPEQHHTQSTLAHAHSTRRPVPSPLWAQINKIWSILQYIPPPSTKKNCAWRRQRPACGSASEPCGRLQEGEHMRGAGAPRLSWSLVCVLLVNFNN